MRVFIDYIDYSGIFHISEVLQSFFVSLFRKVVHHDHFEVVLSVRKSYQVFDSSMRLHYQIHEFFIDRVSVRLQKFLEFFLLFFSSGTTLLFQSVQTVHHKFDEPGD